MTDIKDPLLLDKQEKKTRAKAQKSFKYSDELYEVTEKKVDSIGEIREVKMIAPPFRKSKANHINRCKLRAARAFDVTIEHLQDAYRQLNGKKIDGFYITDIIDRYGFSNGEQLSRPQLSEKYGHTNNIYPLDIAAQKLKEIINNENVAKAYSDHVKDVKTELNKELNDKAIYGE